MVDRCRHRLARAGWSGAGGPLFGAWDHSHSRKSAGAAAIGPGDSGKYTVASPLTSRAPAQRCPRRGEPGVGEAAKPARAKQQRNEKWAGGQAEWGEEGGLLECARFFSTR